MDTTTIIYVVAGALILRTIVKVVIKIYSESRLDMEKDNFSDQE